MPPATVPLIPERLPVPPKETPVNVKARISPAVSTSSTDIIRSF